MRSDTQRRERFEAVSEEVFEPLQRYLRRRASSQDAEDALADVMLTLWRRLDDLPEGQTLPWAYGVARRTLANQRRGRSRHLRLVQRLESESRQESLADPADLGLDPELEEALGGLKDEDRDILRLWAWEQLEPREIAPVLGITVNAATLRLSRARKKLAAALARQNPPAAGHNQVEGTLGDTR